MKIVVNHDNLTPDDSWQYFYKVRAIIENDKGEFIITNEGGKCIFPGGKIDKGESNREAIKREIKEETGLEFTDDEFNEVLELHTIYKDFYNFRTDSMQPRSTITTYYYVKCSRPIDYAKLNLTPDEINMGFKIAFVDSNTLLEMLSQDHSSADNGVYFDEENRIVIDNVLRNIIENPNKKTMN